MLGSASAVTLSFTTVGSPFGAPPNDLPHHMLRALYDVGEDVTLCWGTAIGDKSASREECNGAYMEFVTDIGIPQVLYSDVEYSITFHMHVPTTLDYDATVGVPHTNLHSCLRNNIFCTPFVANTPELATHAPALSGWLDSNGDATFTNTNQLAANQYTIIAHGRWYDTAGTKHDMARARIVNVEDPPGSKTTLYVIVGLACVAAIAVIYAAFVCARHLKKRYDAGVRNRIKAELARKAAEARIGEAIKQVQTCLFPFCIVKFSDFKQFGRLESHETCRNRGLLKMFDTWDMCCDFASTHRILFVSHQWLGFDEPDPNNEHYPIIVDAAETLCTDYNIEASDLYVFVDYMSMPQLCKRSLSSAISTLSAYTAVCKYFLICTPPVMHADRKIAVNGDTYLKRGWCRFEQWARLTTGGLQDIYVYRGQGLEKLADATFEPWVAESINVFQGEFNEESQKDELVNLMLGLYAYALLDLANTDVQPLKAKAHLAKKTVFPESHFAGLVDVLEEQVADGSTAFHCTEPGRALRRSATRLSFVHESSRPKYAAGPKKDKIAPADPTPEGNGTSAAKYLSSSAPMA